MITEWRASAEGLEPRFAKDVTTLLEQSPYAWVVLSTYRSMAEQTRLWEAYRFGEVRDGVLVRGAKAAPPGRSAHNYGLAVDVVLDVDPATPGLQPSWDTKLAGWTWLKAACLAHPRLKSGWSFGDWPHIERYQWEQYKTWAVV
jgi:hypothetical protein